MVATNQPIKLSLQRDLILKNIIQLDVSGWKERERKYGDDDFLTRDELF